VAAAKGELFATAQAGDVCVVNADDPLVMGLPVPSGVRMNHLQVIL
jgi:UDP-N-acetylmuramoyl-tripeptide--D-alanyl-D-alanine ligase